MEGRPRLWVWLCGGGTPEGVRVAVVEGDAAVAEFDGGRHCLVVKQHVVSIGRDKRGAQLVTIEADGRSMFRSPGTVNGAVMQFAVNTGATFVAPGRGDAQRAGLDLMRAEPIMRQTANSLIRGWRLSFNPVSLGGVTLWNVEGVVHGSDLPVALLGMSFLNRMEMRRGGSTLQFRQRF